MPKVYSEKKYFAAFDGDIFFHSDSLDDTIQRACSFMHHKSTNKVAHIYRTERNEIVQRVYGRAGVYRLREGVMDMGQK